MTTDPATTQVVIFSFDGTLFKTHEAIFHCLKHTFNCMAEKRKHPADDRMRALIKGGFDSKACLDLLNTKDPTYTSNRKKWFHMFQGFYAKQGIALMKPYHGIEAVISVLKANKIAACIVCDTTGSATMLAALRLHGMGDLCPPELICGNNIETFRPKPHPEKFETGLAAIIREKTSWQILDPSRFLVVGDQATDLQFAAALGAKSVWCTEGYGNAELCKAIEPDYQIQSLEDIIGILRLPFDPNIPVDRDSDYETTPEAPQTPSHVRHGRSFPGAYGRRDKYMHGLGLNLAGEGRRPR